MVCGLIEAHPVIIGIVTIRAVFFLRAFRDVLNIAGVFDDDALVDSDLLIELVISILFF